MAGNVVVDQGLVTRIVVEGTGQIEVLAIYGIEYGKSPQAGLKMGEFDWTGSPIDCRPGLAAGADKKC